MRTIQRQIVSALLFSKDNKLFMGKKDPKEGGVYADCWHIPGGGIDQNESKHDALQREIKEEVGIDISDYTFELVDDKNIGTAEKTLKETGERVLVTMHFSVYKIRILDKKHNEIRAHLNDDLVTYKWFNLSELQTIPLTPPSITLFKKLGYIK